MDYISDGLAQDWYLQCVSNVDTTVLCLAIHITTHYHRNTVPKPDQNQPKTSSIAQILTLCWNAYIKTPTLFHKLDMWRYIKYNQ